MAPEDLWNISERVAELRNEIAGLQRASEVYLEASRHTHPEILEHVRRRERLGQILTELSEIAGRNAKARSEWILERKPLDWAA